MSEDKSVLYEFQFKGVEYIVTMSFTNEDDDEGKLQLELEERETAERWKATFDVAYIEDLTRKTGNFKQFSIFVHMLETALSRTSDAVSIELYTYSELEMLRNKKMNISTSSRQHITSSSNLTGNNKRYLILTYNVEFDRIHYPLQLTYQGKPDPVALQEVIRKLKDELNMYRSQSISSPSEAFVKKLQKENERLIKDKERLETELKTRVLDTNETLQKEVKILKQMIKSIEEDSLKEKTTWQKQMQKKIREMQQLNDELDEVRASERNLRHQVKTLQNELSVYRRGRVSNNNISGHNSRESSLTRSNRLSNESASSLRNRRMDRSNSADSRTRRTSTSSGRDLVKAVANGLKNTRSRSQSRDSHTNSVRNRSQSPGNLSNGQPRRNGSAGSGKKFNPTEYVRDKNRKLEEIELKKQREINRNMNSITAQTEKLRFNVKNSKMRTPSVSSINSGHDSDLDSIHSSYKSSRNNFIPRSNGGKATQSTPNNSLANKKAKKMNRIADFRSDEDEEDENDSTFYAANKISPPKIINRESELMDLDERLRNLQKFMKSNMPN